MKTTQIAINGSSLEVTANPARRLSDVLRDDLGLTGTKVGCDAGDCGACTVLLDDKPVNACMVPIGRLNGHSVVTIEGLDTSGEIESLQQSFLAHGAAQCGICTPGMLVSAAALLRRNTEPTEAEVQDALGGVLCRCTGYRKIVAAVTGAPVPFPDISAAPSGKAVGHRATRVDGLPKLNGRDIFGADGAPADALVASIVRSPHHRARFELGDLEAYVDNTSGLVAVFTAVDIPGNNRFGVIPATADQPVFAESEVRFRGEAVAMIAGEPGAIAGLDLEAFPITWEPLNPVMSIEEALGSDAPRIHLDRPHNVLTRGLVQRGDIDGSLNGTNVIVEGEWTTGFVEHAYIEPEAGHAVRVADHLEVYVSTQSPHLDRRALAEILDLEPEAIQIRPSSVGGGFGSKLDLSVQPYVALAAWKLGRPVRLTYSRPESMRATTKRHPSQINVRLAASPSGKLEAMDFEGTFNTGAYASWGPTVANRVPVHAGGPYIYSSYRARTTAVHTNGPPAGAFRGFGVPQSTIAQEGLFDELADALGMDRLEFRMVNALTEGQPTPTGQVFQTGVGFHDCLASLHPHWERARVEAAEANANGPSFQKRGVGIAGMWYGCGNTALPNPSTVRIGLRNDGRVVLFQGAVDIGQGANTVMTQICADSLGVDMATIVRIGPDTDTTPDAGKTSASRQTYVTGNATALAAASLRTRLLDLTGAAADAHLDPGADRLVIHDHGNKRTLDLRTLPADDFGLVAVAEATYDPPTTPLDENGQGDPYAVFGFGAHLAELCVDTELGTVRLLRITAAHDVGRAINPTLVEGQIEGGIAQGIGLALMEEYLPGRNENLHDYLIPTIGDVPEIVSILIESNDPHGPYGAKGIGEHSLIPTAPAIMNGIRDAIGVTIRSLPATPDTVRAAVLRNL
jgi:CO/xanthine dehydrogenase Mo-binding subunit/aerobic-type carbon monoxide dehydrogenase small subunit (CoxS/CutS family)